MKDSYFVRTTFFYSNDSQWKFKHIAAVKRKKMRDITCSLLDQFIEDYEDERRKDRIEKYLQQKEAYQEWRDVKRGAALDELQNFSE